MKIFLLLLIGIWIGMLLGISFLEAPLKFKAPNITLPLGLGIGRIVFAALNKFEQVFSLVLLLWLGYQYKQLDFPIILGMGSVVLLVVIQTYWLLPILDKRAVQIVQGIAVDKSFHHFYYVAIELLKTGLLIFSFIKTYHYEGYL